MRCAFCFSGEVGQGPIISVAIPFRLQFFSEWLSYILDESFFASARLSEIDPGLCEA